MKRIFFVACAAAALTFASCGSKNASTEQQATDAAQATEQAAEAAAPAAEAAADAAQAVVNEALVALQNKINDFKAKVEAASKDDVKGMVDEAKALGSEIEAATLTDEEKQGLKDAFNAVMDVIANKLK